MVANPINQDLFMAIHSFCLSRLSSDQDNLYSRKTDYLGIPRNEYKRVALPGSVSLAGSIVSEGMVSSLIMGIFHT